MSKLNKPTINRLDCSFYSQNTLTVAQCLLGKVMVCGTFRGIITETEAYIGSDDPACHAARGRTARNDVMFGPPGLVYVYLIYGMYYCLNFVTEREGYPAAVLIRGIKLIENHREYLNGPGKLCRCLQIHKDFNRLDLTSSPSMYVEEVGSACEYEATPRIGIKVGIEKPWRFVMKQESIDALSL